MAAGDAPAEGAALADEVVLADELGEGPRPHPGRERLALRRRLEQGLRPGATGAGDRRSTGRHAADGTAESTYRVNRWRPFTRISRTARIPSRKPPTRMIRRTSRWT